MFLALLESTIVISTRDLVIVHTWITLVPPKILTCEHVLACNDVNTKHPPNLTCNLCENTYLFRNSSPSLAACIILNAKTTEDSAVSPG